MHSQIDDTSTPPRTAVQIETPVDNPTAGTVSQSYIRKLPVIRTIADAIESYGRLIVSRKEFRWLWLAGVISTVGNFFTHIAIVTIIERVFSNDPRLSGTAVSGIFLSGFIPPIVLMPFTGVIADMVDRRKVMLISDVLRMLIVLLFNIVLLDERKLYWILYVVETIMWVLNSFFDPVSVNLFFFYLMFFTVSRRTGTTSCKKRRASDS